MDNGASSYLRFLDGDDSALTQIVEEYKDGLILYLNGYVKNLHTAEELMEETFFRIIVKKPRFFARYSFKTWLYTIARNIATDYIRKNSKMCIRDRLISAKSCTSLYIAFSHITT